MLRSFWPGSALVHTLQFQFCAPGTEDYLPIPAVVSNSEDLYHVHDAVLHAYSINDCLAKCWKEVSGRIVKYFKTAF